jgi:Protein of unknown function (DUF2924)
VLEDGFEYEGQRYRSLSMIAAQITGAHCRHRARSRRTQYPAASGDHSRQHSANGDAAIALAGADPIGVLSSHHASEFEIVPARAAPAYLAGKRPALR